MNDSTNDLDSRVPLYAVFNDYGIWSTSRTAQEALEGFKETVGPDAQDFPGRRVALMTRRLAERVYHHGFDAKRDSFDVLPDGRLDLAYMPHTVQMVAALPAERGYIEPVGEPEDLEGWVDALADHDVVSCEAVLGWPPYSHLVRLRPQVGRDDRDDVWYLVPDEAMPTIQAELETNAEDEHRRRIEFLTYWEHRPEEARRLYPEEAKKWLPREEEPA